MSRPSLAGSTRLVIFDFDGTLIDSKHDIATSLNLTLEELDLPTRSPEEIFSFVGDGIKRLLRVCVGEGNDARYEEALLIFRRHYLAHCLDTTRLYPGLNQLFDEGRNEIYTKAIATNKQLDYTLRIVEGLKINEEDHFAEIVGPTSDKPALKPDPEMLWRILKNLEIQPEAAMLVGDSTNDVQAAQAAGMRACAVGYGYGNREKVQALNPDHYCEKPNDLLSFLFG